MNDTKVVRYEPWGTENTAFMETDEEGTYVTHADYRALEEELAALRVRVGELVEADRAFDYAHEPVSPPCNLGVDHILIRKCAARRKSALESMK